jgi:hypothetical protein
VQLHAGQSQIFRDLFIKKKIRHAVAVCSRGWGKTYLGGAAAMMAVKELIKLPAHVPNKNVFIIAPTFEQVTDIYYPVIGYDFGMEDQAIKASRSRGRFLFKNNVVLRLVSYESVERLRGTGGYFFVNDEVASWQKGVGLKEAWEGIIEPCISTRWSPMRAEQVGSPNCGRSLTIGTPKGYDYFHDMYNKPEEDPLWGRYHFDYTKSPFIDPAEIERIRHTISPMDFNREYKASFEESGARVFYCFDRKIHVNRELPYFQDDEVVHVNIDFNVNLQCSSMFAVRNNHMHFLDEVQRLPNTEQLAIYLTNKFPGKEIRAYPDPTGNSKKTSAPVGSTDFSILRNHGIKVFARSSSPSIVNSVASVNAKLMTAAGDVSMYFHPRCKGTIESMEKTKWVESNPNLAVIDKSESVEHFSDGVRYGTEYLFPVRLGTKKTSRGFNF